MLPSGGGAGGRICPRDYGSPVHVIPRELHLVLSREIAGLMSSASAVTFDARGDFSTTTNPNGAWSLGQLSGTTFTAGDSLWNNAGWQLSGSPFNAGPATGGVFPGQEPDVLFLQPPGGGSAEAAIEWTAPGAGTAIVGIRVDFGSFVGQGFDGVSYRILSGVTVLDSGILAPISGNGEANLGSAGYGRVNFNQSLSVMAGQKLYLAIGANGSGSADSTFAKFNVDFTPVPEPGVVSFSGVMLSGLLLRRRRR
jgi:hypothetical protein